MANTTKNKYKKRRMTKYNKTKDNNTSRSHSISLSSSSSSPTGNRGKIWRIFIMLICIFSCNCVLVFASSSDYSHDYDDYHEHPRTKVIPTTTTSETNFRTQQQTDQLQKRASLIVDEMSKASSIKDNGRPRHLPNSFLNENHVPKDCWIDTVEILEQSFLEDSSLAHPLLSYQQPSKQPTNILLSPSAANFCSSLDLIQKQAMALGLTKCHFYSSGLAFHIPNECTFDELSTGRDKHAIQSCLTELNKTAFLVYSQFFTHTEMMCIKLTEDVRLYRKEEVLDRYEKKFQWMGEKLEQFEQLENKALERFEHSANVMDRFEATAKLMDDKIVDIQRIENVTKDLGRNIERTVSMTISSAMRESTMSFLQEVYGQQEIQWMSVMFATLKQNGFLGWHTLYMWGRYCLIFTCLCLPTFVFRHKLGPCRRFVCMGSIGELALEHVCHYLAAIGIITRDECDGYISWMRSNDVVLYLLAMMMSIVWRTVFGIPSSSSKNETISGNTSNSDMTMLLQMNQVLEELKNRFEIEQNQIHSHLEQLSRREQQFEQQMFAFAENVSRPFERYHARPQPPEDMVFSTDDNFKIHQPSFFTHNSSALVSPWSPTKQQSPSSVNHDTFAPNESFGCYHTPTHQTSFNDKLQSSITGETKTQRIMAIHRHQSNGKDNHSNTNVSPPHSSFPSSSFADQSDSITTSESPFPMITYSLHQQKQTCLEEDDGENDCFDDCRSHDSFDTSMVEIARGNAYNGEEEDDDLNLGKRKRKDASSSISKKRQK